MRELRTRNSGEALYFANSDSQSASDMGGREPVTGRHSVMDRLRGTTQYVVEGAGCSVSYPDSVRRVKPPNTTMPNTLAALARSQYATAFELVSGDRDDFLMVFSTSLTASLSFVDVRKVRRQESRDKFVVRRASRKSLANACL